MAKELILLNISGPDKPGITSKMTEILSNHKAHILDIGQAVIHNFLNIGILFEVNDEFNSSPILKDLLFKAYKLGIDVKFTAISEEDYEKWVLNQGKERYIITLLGRYLTAEQISKLTSIISNQGLNIDIINRLSGRTSLKKGAENKNVCVEFYVSGKPNNLQEMKKSFLELSPLTGVDIAFQADDIFRRSRRMVCFDMDSTLIQTEVIDELAEYAGVREEVSRITEAAMHGEIDFKESFKQRLNLMKGVKEEVLKEIVSKIPLTQGAERLFKALKRFGFKTAILSGGFTYFAHHLQERLGIDYVFANELEIKNGELTGSYIGEVIDGKRKAELLKVLADRENLLLDQIVAVGDGSNDLPMISVAGLGIAFHAKPIVKENARTAISTIGLDGILYLMGYRDRDIES